MAHIVHILALYLNEYWWLKSNPQDKRNVDKSTWIMQVMKYLSKLWYTLNSKIKNIYMNSYIAKICEKIISWRFLFYFRERECMHAWASGGKVKRRGEGDPLLSMEPYAGLEPMTARSWPEPKPRDGCLTYWTTQPPQKTNYLMK